MTKELLFSVKKEDFEIERYCAASGNGGQNVNKVSSAVRMKHKESGAIGQSTTERDQHKNLKIAFKRLVESQKFQLWIKKKSFEISSGKTIEQIVDESLNDKNLKWECKDEEGKWELL